jgi:hypothetical protein
MAEKLGINHQICCTGLTIFHLYQKKFSYTEFDRFMVATLSMFLASKIDYFNKYRYFDYIQYYYDNRKGPRGRLLKKFEDVKDKLKEDFVD